MSVVGEKVEKLAAQPRFEPCLQVKGQGVVGEQGWGGWEAVVAVVSSGRC
jgi:hypothetical protein